jgi:GMP synthase (glutamine-hydrolysing)
VPVSEKVVRTAVVTTTELTTAGAKGTVEVAEKAAAAEPAAAEAEATDVKRVLVFKHVAHEPLGRLDPLLRNAGFRIRFVNFDRDPDARPDVDRYDGLVVLGGPMGVDDVARHPHLAIEIAAIERAIADRKPVLGICLGAQLAAAALGAKVRRNARREIGWYEVRPTEQARHDPLFAPVCDPETLFQWHADTFDIPDGAVHLASSAACDAQAFRHGDNVYGLQFHLEVDAPMVERWLGIESLRREIAEHGFGADEIRSATRVHIARSEVLADQLFSAFIDRFASTRRRVVVPSR